MSTIVVSECLVGTKAPGREISRRALAVEPDASACRLIGETRKSGGDNARVRMVGVFEFNPGTGIMRPDFHCHRGPHVAVVFTS